ncbi:MAG: Stp1/IreP family PP2C-type Ser/Thr phosphatase [Desulfobacterota bacterium]|nr:Stp1/IreP family PP2C-type Ser/Thr phosphatase [Thermodesulfobacteriota bacterium]
MFEIRSYGRSDPGLKRANNEDAFLIKPELNLFVVADGMGGAAAGEVASQIFIDTALEVFSTSILRPGEESSRSVQKAFQLANEKILKYSATHPHHQGLGCTAELITFSNQTYVLGHVGDSRTYLLRKGELRQLTRDHSYLQAQIDQGLLQKEEAKHHPMRHVILRAVGIEEALALDLIRGRVFPGDLFLLCSDGLTDMVEDDEILNLLHSSLRLDQKGEGLIDLAKAAGGKDNITVVLCEMEER